MVYLLREGIKRREVIYFSSGFVSVLSSSFSVLPWPGGAPGSRRVPLAGFGCLEETGRCRRSPSPGVWPDCTQDGPQGVRGNGRLQPLKMSHTGILFHRLFCFVFSPEMPNLLNLAELSRLLSNPVAISLHRSMEKAGAVSGATGEPTSVHPDDSFPP